MPQSITNKQEPGAITFLGVGMPSRGDRADGHSLLALRGLLLEAPSVQRRLSDLAAVRGFTNTYVCGVLRLSEEVDGHLTAGEIDNLARHLRTAGVLPQLPALAIRVGHHRSRAGAPSELTVELVVQALALRVDGFSMTQAHDLVAASEFGRQPQDIGVFRHRLRGIRERRGDAGPSWWQSEVFGLTP